MGMWWFWKILCFNASLNFINLWSVYFSILASVDHIPSLSCFIFYLDLWGSNQPSFGRAGAVLFLEFRKAMAYNFDHSPIKQSNSTRKLSTISPKSLNGNHKSAAPCDYENEKDALFDAFRWLVTKDHMCPLRAHDHQNCFFCVKQNGG